MSRKRSGVKFRLVGSPPRPNIARRTENYVLIDDSVPARAAFTTPAPGEKAAEPAGGLVFRKRHGDDSWGSIRAAFEGACREAKIPDFRLHETSATPARRGW